MPNLKELREARAAAGAEIKRMADTLDGKTKLDFTAEEKPKWDTVNADFDRLGRQIEIAERADSVSQQLSDRNRDDGRPTPGAEDTGSKKGKRSKPKPEEVRALAFQAWVRYGHGKDLTQHQRDAAKLLRVNLRSKVIDIRLARSIPQSLDDVRQMYKRAQSAFTGTSGAYTIPQGFVYNLERAMLAYNGVRGAGVEVMRTDSGNQLPWPTVNDTSNQGELIAENTGVNNQDVAFGQTVFGAYKFSSKQVLVPAELMEDSAFNMSDTVSSLLGERLGRVQAQYETTGTGVGQPQGLATAATLGVNASGAYNASPNPYVYDDLIELIHSIDPAYRSDSSVGFMMNDAILKVLRKVKDSYGRPLLEDTTSGVLSRIKGYPVYLNQKMASAPAVGAVEILFGAFRKFKCRDVATIRMKRLEERYADSDQIGFIAFIRSDSKILDAGTHPIKYLTHSS